jgi:hypothetical protein
MKIKNLLHFLVLAVIFIIHNVGLFILSLLEFIKNPKILNIKIVFGSLFCLYIFYLRFIYFRPLGVVVKHPISLTTKIITIYGIILFLIFLILTILKLVKKDKNKTIFPIWMQNWLFRYNKYLDDSLTVTSKFIINKFTILQKLYDYSLEPYINFMSKKRNLFLLLWLIYGIPFLVSLSFFIDTYLGVYKYFPYVAILLIIPLVIKVGIFIIISEIEFYHQRWMNFFDIRVVMLKIVYFINWDIPGKYGLLIPASMPAPLTEEEFDNILKENAYQFKVIHCTWYLSVIRWERVCLNRVFKKHILITRCIILSLFLGGWVNKLYLIMTI